LYKAHELPTHRLINAAVAPFNEHADGQSPRISISGFEAAVSGSALTRLALLFQEFVTNSAKYGTLSTAQGRIEAVCVEEKDTVAVLWTENGGPQLAGPPASEGFGGILSRQAVKALGGKIEREWRPEGLASAWQWFAIR
jgi:two-component sensor histidine kinase